MDPYESYHQEIETLDNDHICQWQIFWYDDEEWSSREDDSQDTWRKWIDS
jgi:hypothetical protein|tara:strand:+ start:648 stop:797 length:150 start_codon:yes stop_codon:yes gene_type:complete